MALSKCKACGHEVSKRADKCPNCGEPLKRRSIGCLGAILIIGVALVIGAMMSMEGTDKSTVATPAPKQTADCSKQADRQAFMQKMINEGYWQKTERPATLLRVHVMLPFLALTMDDKKSFLSVASAYDLCTGGEGMITIIDAITGKDIGRFDEYGLHMKS